MRQIQCFRQKVLDYFQKQTDRPVLVGQICLALNLRINEAETLLEDLVTEGKLRYVTPAEKRQFDIQQGYVLV
jgi:predicted nucleic acid-binding protein